MEENVHLPRPRSRYLGKVEIHTAKKKVPNSDAVFFSFFIVKEKTTDPKMVSLVLKPLIPNLDLISELIAVSVSPKNITLID